MTPTLTLLPYEGLLAKGIVYSKVQLWRLMKMGAFPRAVKLSAGRNAWVASEIDEWIVQRVAERDTRIAA